MSALQMFRNFLSPTKMAWASSLGTYSVYTTSDARKNVQDWHLTIFDTSDEHHLKTKKFVLDSSVRILFPFSDNSSILHFRYFFFRLSLRAFFHSAKHEATFSSSHPSLVTTKEKSLYKREKFSNVEIRVISFLVLFVRFSFHCDSTKRKCSEI